MRRQRKTSLHMSGEEDPLVLMRLRLSFFSRQPPRTLCDQAVGDEIFKIPLRDRRGQKIALDPARRRRGLRDRRLPPLGSLLALRHRGGGRRDGVGRLALKQSGGGGGERNEEKGDGVLY
jgi:hypothetical protein